MTMHNKLLGLLPHTPTIRWTPHDIDHASSSPQKPKSITTSLLHLPKVLSKFSVLDSSTSNTLQSGNRSYHSTSFRHNRHRKRSALSLSDDVDGIEPRVHLQSQSLFFSKLPPEVRNMVYAYVMGEETVHLTLGAKKRFAHFLCRDESESDEFSSSHDTAENGELCRCKVLVGGKSQSARLEGSSTKMLRVCWRMYLEAHPHLYIHHTFSLLHITHLLYLPTRVPFCTLSHIRTLRLRWTIRALPYYRRAGQSNALAYPEDSANWEKAWEILGSLEGLKDLKVVIVDASREGIWEAAWLSLEERLVESIENVKGVRKVEVVLPYWTCRVDWDVGGVVFRRPSGTSGMA